jgi:hypothetical protein
MKYYVLLYYEIIFAWTNKYTSALISHIELHFERAKNNAEIFDFKCFKDHSLILARFEKNGLQMINKEAIVMQVDC